MYNNWIKERGKIILQIGPRRDKLTCELGGEWEAWVQRSLYSSTFDVKELLRKCMVSVTVFDLDPMIVVFTYYDQSSGFIASELAKFVCHEEKCSNSSNGNKRELGTKGQRHFPLMML
jgi:hypothetical protein